MVIEATGILADPQQPDLYSEGGKRSKKAQIPGTDPIAKPESGRHRSDDTAPGISRRFAARFRRLAHEGFEKPNERQRLAKDLEHRFRDALHTLKKAGLLDKSEVRSLRRAYRHALKAVTAPSAPAEISETTSVRQSRSFSLDVKTVEGDTVRIELQRQVSRETDTTASRQQTTVTSQSVLRFSVEGNLNDEERAAIEDLVARVDQLATRFFGGDVQATLNQVRDFGLPDDEIASFSLDLSDSLEARAIRAYREVEELAVPTDVSEVEQDSEVLAELRQLASSSRLESLFVESRRLVFDFFRVAVESDPASETPSLPASDGSPV